MKRRSKAWLADLQRNLKITIKQTRKFLEYDLSIIFSQERFTLMWSYRSTCPYPEILEGIF